MCNENTRVMASRLRQTISGSRGRAPPPPAPETSIYDLKVEELRTLLRDAGLSDKGLKRDLQLRLNQYRSGQFAKDLIRDLCALSTYEDTLGRTARY